MGAPTVDHSMLSDGFKITSGPDGFRAQASFVCLWQDAFTFHDQVMGYATAAVVGPLTFNTPWQFPGSTTARLFCSSCEITPFALDGGGNPIGVALGMAPGEFWSHARIDVTFETPNAPQSPADDPGNLTQLDPAEPVYNCEQSIRIGTKTENRPKEDYKYNGSDAKLADDVTVYKGESNITLSWAFVPFNPWRKYRPFINGVNDAAIFDCGRGELMFAGADIQDAKGPQGKLGKSVTVNLSVNDVDWNKRPLPGGGTPTLLETKTGAVNPHAYKDFRLLLLS